MILPSFSDVPPQILALLSEQSFSLVTNIPLIELTNGEFIEAFVKQGAVYMLSNGTQIDTEDCVAVLPTGDLVLNITKETYTELGLEGKPSIFHKKHRDKYVVKIPLTADYFKPGKKFHERVKWCLNKRPDLKFSFLVAWDPNDESVSPTSLGHYFEHRLGYKNNKCRLKASRRQVRYLAVPELLSDSPDETEQTCGYEQYYEWLGAATLAVNCDGSADSYVSTYSTPEPHRKFHTTMCSFKGFITLRTIGRILGLLRELLDSIESSAPWLALTVQGFDDSPASCRLEEHGFHTSGDHSYTHVVFPGGRYWLYKAYGAHDVIT